MKVRLIRQAKKLKGKRILLRADFNVPLGNGGIKDDYKIAAGLPTIRFLLRHKCRVIIATHLGRPLKNNPQTGDKDKKYFSTKPIAKRLGELLGRRVDFVEDCIGFEPESKIHKMKEGDILFLENLRFNRGEEENNDLFAKRLSRLADIYVNDAFAVSHRAHASVGAIKKYLPAYAGLLVAQEVENLSRVLKPKKPLVILIGGAKISTKLPLLMKLGGRAEHILIGGALANDFLSSLNFEVGKSLVKKEDIKLAKKVYRFYGRFKNKKILLPLDVVVSDRSDGVGKAEVKSVNRLGKNDIILDIGPKTIKLYAKFIKKANTIIWNGPLGKYENDSFKYGTMSLARVIAARSRGQAFGAVGGGETVEALKKTRMLEYIDWVSTGGGAMLAFLSGKEMPGLKGIVK